MLDIRLTIIIPTYNRPEMLERAISSCREVNHSEVVVVNNGDKLDFLKSFDNVRVYHSKKGNANVARNVGIHAARGNFIKFLDDDDVLNPIVVNRQLTLIERLEGKSIIYSDFLINENNKDKYFMKSQLISPYTALITHWSIAPFCYMLSTKLAREILWDPNLKGYQDTDFFIRVAESNTPFTYLQGSCGTQFKHTEGSIMNRSLKIRRESFLTVFLGAFGRDTFHVNKEVWIEVFLPILRYYYLKENKDIDELLGKTNCPSLITWNGVSSYYWHGYSILERTVLRIFGLKGIYVFWKLIKILRR